MFYYRPNKRQPMQKVKMARISNGDEVINAYIENKLNIGDYFNIPNLGFLKLSSIDFGGGKNVVLHCRLTEKVKVL